MTPRNLFVPACALLLLACASEDPRVPEVLYQEALELSKSGKIEEAKALMDVLVERYPNAPKGQQAAEDRVLLETSIKRTLTENQRLLRAGMKRVVDALERYKAKTGEYPASLGQLVPEYIEQMPATPWHHPYLYRPFVAVPIEDVQDRRGSVTQRFNTSYDRYHLAYLGIDLKLGGNDLATDVIVANGEFLKETSFPPVPAPQPVR